MSRARSPRCILGIDQGTTSSRALLFDASGVVARAAQREFSQFFPHDGQVEHDAAEIWRVTRDVCAEALLGVSLADVAAVGITNQRETTVLWDRRTGAPLHRAIVWQDRRTTAICADLRQDPGEEDIRARTGLLPDPYFSATKLAWLLDHVPGARDLAQAGDACFGTIDSWLLWNFTGGAVHATDATNAARTMLFNVTALDWDETLLRRLDIPRAVLPQVRFTGAEFGVVAQGLPGAGLPILGVAGDQQAAAVGQACLAPGDAKATYGTGCFVLANIGADMMLSRNRLLTTIAHVLDGTPAYALEGSIFMAGGIVQWLRDRLGVIPEAGASAALAAAASSESRVIMVPAFTGLGAPHWDPDARGALLGMTRDTGVAEIVRAGLESVSFQTRDLVDAMETDLGGPLRTLRVDGGMVANDWFCQNLADTLGRPVERPVSTETTAWGAACLAGLECGLFRDPDDLAARWRLDRRFVPIMPDHERRMRYSLWREAVGRITGSREAGRLAL